MARYVLVEFDDNDAARRFIESVNGEFSAVPGDYKSRRVRAVWGKPTKFCECEAGRGGNMAFRRGTKSGWWVHNDCGKPTKAWARGNHWFAALGNNLLPGNKDWTPKGWGYL